VGLLKEEFPEGEVGDFFDCESYLLVLVSAMVQAKAQLV
jgi:hypothetical protein